MSGEDEGAAAPNGSAGANGANGGGGGGASIVNNDVVQPLLTGE